LRALARNLSLAGVALVLALLASEWALRAFAPIGYSASVEYLADPHVAFRLVPDRVYRLPGGGTCTINRLGYRGPEVAIPKPPGVFRIVVFGGSSTFSYLTDDAKIWPRLLEGELTSVLGRPVEVVNVSAPGRSSFDSMLLYLYKVRDLEPDAAIIYHTWNDMKLFAGIDEHGELRKAPYRKPSIREFLKRFELPRRVRMLQRPDGPLAPREERWLEVDPARAVTIEDGGPAHLFEERTLRDFVRLLQSDGVLPILASQAGLLSADNLEDPAVRERVYTEFQGLDYPEILRQWDWISGTLARTAASNDALYLDVRSAVRSDLDHFRDHVHLTELGNTAVADAFATALTASPRFLAAARPPDARSPGAKDPSS
jgi:hypothetical protein